MNSEQPSHGLRFELIARTADAGTVAYDVTLTGPETAATGTATVTLADGRVQLDLPASVPAWATSTLNAFLRSEWRSRRDDPEDPWPRRLTRWRAARE